VLLLLPGSVAKNNNHWLGFKLTGTRSNRDAIGARVTLHGEKRIWVDEVRSGSSYNSSSDLRLHFGLALETKINSIEVRWPSGQTESFDAPGIDQYLDLIEGKGKQSPGAPDN